MVGRGHLNTTYGVNYLRTSVPAREMAMVRPGLSDGERGKVNQALNLCGSLAEGGPCDGEEIGYGEAAGAPADARRPGPRVRGLQTTGKSPKG